MGYDLDASFLNTRSDFHIEKTAFTLMVYILSLSKLETVLGQIVGGPLNGEP